MHDRGGKQEFESYFGRHNANSILMNTKRVSVILPVYNNFVLVKNLLKVLIQDIGLDDEILLINDGSTDFEAHQYLKLSNIDRRIFVFNLKKVGLVNALNFGIDKATKELIARVDSDDGYILGRVPSQRSLFESQQNLVLCFSDYIISNSSNRYLGTIPSAVTDFGVRLSFLNPQRSAHPSAMFDKQAAEKSGKYLPVDYPAEDLGLWFRISQLGEVASIPFVFLDYKLSPSSITGKNQALMRERTRIIINNQIKNCNFEHLHSMLEKTTSEYSLTPLRQERIVLLIRDTLTFLRVRRQIQIDSLIFCFKGLVNLGAITAICKLAYYNTKRRIYKSKHLSTT